MPPKTVRELIILLESYGLDTDIRVWSYCENPQLYLDIGIYVPKNDDED